MRAGKLPAGDSILDPFIGFLTRKSNEGCRNANSPSPYGGTGRICGGAFLTGLAGYRAVIG